MSGLSPGTPILVRAVVERIVGSAIEIHVGDGGVTVVEADVVGPVKSEPRLFRYRAAQFEQPMALIAEHAGWAWLDRGGEPVAARMTWIVEINREQADV